MANSYVEIPVSGASTYTFPFPYIAEADVKVYVGGVLQTISTHYTFTSSNIIEFTAGNVPADPSQVVFIQRVTQSDEKLVTYSNTGLDADDLNLGSSQNFYLAQESVDKADVAVSKGVDGTLEVNGRLTNVSDPIDAQDATTKSYIDSIVDTFGTFAISATTEQSYIASQGQTVFTTAKPFNQLGDTLTVYTNGVRQSAYTASGTNTVTLTNPLTAGDEVVILINEGSDSNTDSGTSYVVSATREENYTATSGQTSFTTVNSFNQAGDRVTVYLNGIRQTAFSLQGSNTVLMDSALSAGDEVTILINDSTDSDVVTNATNVVYSPAGTGAVTTDVQSKLRETVSVKDFGAVGDGVTDDTAAIQAAIDSLTTSTKKLIFPAGGNYLVSGLNFAKSNLYVEASGATITLSQDNAVCIDLNSGAVASAIEPNSQSYIFWNGGTILSSLSSPTAAVAFRVYGIRQCTIRNTVIGTFATNMFSSGIQISGLGGHLMEKNRFLNVNIAFDCPKWGTDSYAESNPITTSSFISNEFTFPNSGQQAFNVLCGFNRWRIQGGFINGSENATSMYFATTTTSTNTRLMNISSIGFEQAKQNSKFIHFDDVAGTGFTNIHIDTVYFNGDPAGGGHDHVVLEKCAGVEFTACRFESLVATSNSSIDIDVNCSDVNISRSNYFAGDGVVNAAVRREVTNGVNYSRLSSPVLTGYNGDSFSTSSATLDMSTLLGTSYPQNLAPLAYDLLVQVRDSASAGSSITQVEFTDASGTTTARRKTINLRGVPDDIRIGEAFSVQADANGDIFVNVVASGVSTLDMWIYVQGVYN